MKYKYNVYYAKYVSLLIFKEKSTFFRNKKRYYSSNSSDLPEIVRSRAVIGNEDSSTVPDTASDESKNQRNKIEADLNHELHNRKGLDTAYHPETGIRVPDLNEEDIEKLGPHFEKSANNAEAQHLYDGHLNILTRAHNAVRASSDHERAEKIDMARSMATRDASRLNQVSEASGMPINVDSTSGLIDKINAKHDNMNRDNTEFFKDRVSDLNVAAAHYPNYEDLDLQRDNQYHEMQQSDNGSDSNTDESDISVAEMSGTSSVPQSSVPNNTTASVPRQDSSGIVQDTFDSSDYYDDV